VLGRIHPGPPLVVTPAEAYADPSRGPHDGRPWVLSNFIASLDGATTVDGRSGRLGGDGDRAVFRALRDLADVVLVGAGTARAERYGPPRRPGQRIAVVTARGDLTGLDPLMSSGAAIVVAPEDGPALPKGTLVVRAGRGTVDVAAALAQLATLDALDALDALVVLAEGGPRLHGHLLAAGCVDELCVTVAPFAVGGDSARLAHGLPLGPTPLRLVHVLVDDEGFLYTRWLVER
jgi:riboflavin biosynthesis pyrimidine reductase